MHLNFSYPSHGELQDLKSETDDNKQPPCPVLEAESVSLRLFLINILVNDGRSTLWLSILPNIPLSMSGLRCTIALHVSTVNAVQYVTLLT